MPLKVQELQHNKLLKLDKLKSTRKHDLQLKKPQELHKQKLSVLLFWQAMLAQLQFTLQVSPYLNSHSPLRTVVNAELQLKRHSLSTMVDTVISLQLKQRNVVMFRPSQKQS